MCARWRNRKKLPKPAFQARKFFVRIRTFKHLKQTFQNFFLNFNSFTLFAKTSYHASNGFSSSCEAVNILNRILHGSTSDMSGAFLMRFRLMKISPTKVNPMTRSTPEHSKALDGNLKFPEKWKAMSIFIATPVEHVSSNRANNLLFWLPRLHDELTRIYFQWFLKVSRN